MQGKCIGLFKGVSKAQKPYRIGYFASDIDSNYGFGKRVDSVFLPVNAPDPVLDRRYFWSKNEKGFCDDFIELKL